MNLYITADQIGIQTGGGLVTKHESEALAELGPCEVWGRDQIGCVIDEPWGWDGNVRDFLLAGCHGDEFPKLAHFYAGTFTETIKLLKERKCKVTYTAAAHDIAASRKAHEELGLRYDYPHLNDPEQFNHYVGGYLAADVLICPSQHSANVMRGFGATNKIEVIPHGCHLPEKVAPLPKRFTVGYLGSYSPDKGVRYLLEAWRKLHYDDADLLLAGRESTSPWALHLIEQFGGGNIRVMGWVNRLEDFYGQVSLYAQPSVSEGFGLEVLEAMAHGRPVCVSDGAGASDLWIGVKHEACNVEDICLGIDNMRRIMGMNGPAQSEMARQKASEYTWDKIRSRYQQVWKELLA